MPYANRHSCHPPKDNRKHLTLFTNGLSSEAMRVPNDAEDYRYAELFMELPGELVQICL